MDNSDFYYIGMFFLIGCLVGYVVSTEGFVPDSGNLALVNDDGKVEEVPKSDVAFRGKPYDALKYSAMVVDPKMFADPEGRCEPNYWCYYLPDYEHEKCIIEDCKNLWYVECNDDGCVRYITATIDERGMWWEPFVGMQRGGKLEVV